MKTNKTTATFLGMACGALGMATAVHAVPLTLNSVVTGAIVNPGQRVAYTFNGTPGQRLFYDSLDSSPESIQVQLVNPTGNIVFINQSSHSDGGVFTLTDAGTYTLYLDGNGAATGTYGFRVVDLNSQPALPFNTTITKTLTPGLFCEWYRFTAVGGEHLYFDGQGANSGATWVLYGPSNQGIGSAGIGGDFEPTLVEPGTYLLAIAGNNASPVPYTVQVTSAKTTTNKLQLDTVVAGTIASPGDQAVYTFTGTPGQRLYYDALDADPSSISVRLFNPAGQIVHINQGAHSDSAPFTLVDSGTYSLMLDGNGAATGNYSFRLQNLSSLPAVVLDAVISKSLSPAYGSEWYSLNGTAGQTLYFDGLGANSGASWQLIGSAYENYGSSGIGGDFEVTLPRSGLYFLQLANNSANVVPYSIQVVTFETVSVPLVLGSTVTGTLAEPGERDSYTFAGTAGQRLYFNPLDRDFESINVRLLSPTGVNVWEVNHSSGNGPFTLTQTGTYTFVVDGNGGTVGDYSFRMLDLASAAPITLLAPVSGSLTPRSKTDIYQFNGTKGQRISFDSISATTGDATWRLVNAVNQTLVSGSILTDLTKVVLGDTGTYHLLIEGSSENASPLNYQVRLADASDPAVANSGLNKILTGTLSGTPTTNTFTATAGTVVYYDSQDRTSNGVGIDIRDPSNTLLYSIGGAGDSGAYLLPSSGTYSVVVRGNGTYRFRFVELPTNATPLTLGAEVQTTLDPGYRTDFYRFTGAAGKRLYYDALQNDFNQVNVRLMAPDGALYRINGNADSDVGIFALPFAGTYYLIVESLLATVTDYRFRLLDIDSAPVVTTGTTVNNAFPLPFCAVVYRLAGVQGRSLYLDALASNGGGTWIIYGPNYDALQAPGIASDIEIQNLPLTGEYVLILNSNTPNSTPYTFDIIDPNAGVSDGPEITSLTFAGGNAKVEWTAISGKTYTLQFKAKLSDPAWTDLAGNVVASGTTASKTDPVGSNTLRFYQVKQLP